MVKKLGLLNEAIDYISGTLLDPDSWVGAAAALGAVFILPPELLKFALLAVCVYMIVKPNWRKKFLDGIKK